MRPQSARWVLALAMTSALLVSACASILNPHPPPDPGNLDLSEQRALSKGIVADPDPVSLSEWQRAHPGTAAVTASKAPR